MTREIFNSQIERLQNQWPKAYSADRVLIIWDKVRFMEDEWWQRTVTKFIGHCKSAPLIPEIDEEIFIERKRVSDDSFRVARLKQDIDGLPTCSLSLCSGDGLMFETSSEGYRCVYRCLCQNAAIHDKNIPQWSRNLPVQKPPPRPQIERKDWE